MPRTFCTKSLFVFLLLADTLVTCICSAQSSVFQGADSSVVSVQDLAMPGKAKRAYEKAYALFQKGDFEGSLPYFRTAVAVVPKSAFLHYDLALALLRLGRWDEASENFQKSIDFSNGRFGPSFFGFGVVFYKRGEFAEAESLMKRGLSVAPNSGVGELLLGLAQFAAGRTSDAQRSAEEALRLDPNLFSAYFLLAVIHARLRNRDAAMANVQLYLKKEPHGELRSHALELREQLQQHMDTQSASCVEPCRASGLHP